MIKAAELRLENWFHYHHKDGREGFAQVELGIDIDSIKKGLINASPILITPAILESAGFEIIEPHFSYLMYKNKTTSELTVFLAHDEKGFTFVMDADYPEFVDCSLPFQYVHQLQNLFYALTGSELEIKAMTPSASQTL